MIRLSREELRYEVPFPQKHERLGNRLTFYVYDLLLMPSISAHQTEIIGAAEGNNWRNTLTFSLIYEITEVNQGNKVGFLRFVITN